MISYLRNKFMMEDEIPLLNLLLIMFISLFTAFIKYALSKYIYNKGKEYQNDVQHGAGYERNC